MFGNNAKRLLIGRPLRNEAINDQKYGILWGLPILASDAISSVAYAGQEILMVLIPAVGFAAYGKLTYISVAIIGLLALLMLSYRQTIENYPNGGGAYIVAKENLGIIAGVTAGAALSVDYILTVSVSVSSGVEQITSAFQPLKPYTVPICIVLILLLMVGNLRGIRESSRIFGLPAYAFILGILAMLAVGYIRIKGGYIPQKPTFTTVVQPLTVILILRAFSNGCAALTGVEAVSNAVPNFKHPSTKYAKTVLLLLSIIILFLFGGTSLLANAFPVDPGEKGAMLVLIADKVFDGGFMLYYIATTTFIILVMAANTAYSGFPLLVSVMAKEGYVPRQFGMRGDRLSYSNGIMVLSAVSILLIIIFKAKVSSLIGLYAIGVFISFTLSQFGMYKKWIREKSRNWLSKACLNGFGSFVTAIVVIIIAYTKFHEGAWIVVFIIPLLIIGMLKIKKHYSSVRMQLRVKFEELGLVDIDKNMYRNRVIVPIESINKASIRALRFAKTISDNVMTFNVSIDEESAKEIKERYDALNTDIPLIVKYSPYRRVVDPLLKFIQSSEYDYQKGDMTTVLLPQFVVKHWWQKYLHNGTRVYIERELLKHKHIVVAVMPLQLKDDSFILKKEEID